VDATTVSDSPLAVTVRVSDRATVLVPFTFCYDGICADGIPATDAELPDVRSGGPLTVELPLPGWSVTAGIAPVGSVTADEAQVPLQPGPDGTFVLDAPANPGAYRVSLFAQGDGDAAYRFRWSV
jgi:hypothetical protein